MKEWGDMDQRQHLVMHERHDEKLDAILEHVKDIPIIKADIKMLKADVREVKQDLREMNVRLTNVEEAHNLGS